MPARLRPGSALRRICADEAAGVRLAGVLSRTRPASRPRLRALTSLAAASVLIGLSACAPEDGQQTRPTPQAAETIGPSASSTEQPGEPGEPREPTDGAAVGDAGAA